MLFLASQILLGNDFASSGCLSGSCPQPVGSWCGWAASPPSSPCLTNPVIYSTEVAVCFVAASKQLCEECAPCSLFAQLPCHVESLVKATSPSHSCVRAGALGSLGFGDSRTARPSQSLLKAAVAWCFPGLLVLLHWIASRVTHGGLDTKEEEQS